jgi:hypothetical protein
MDIRTSRNVCWRPVLAALALTVMVFLFGAATNALALEPIVGLWQATWTDASGGANDGNVVANVWDVWHSDRTETQNDNGPVIAGFVCQGAWQLVGKRTYFLTHPSFNYTGADGHLDTTSVSVVYEKVTVSKDGNSFSGTGLIKGLSGLDPFDPSASVLFTLPIDITAKRVVPDPSQLP